MKKTFLIILFSLFLPLMTFAQDKKTAVLFYADWCPHCHKVDAYLTQQGFYTKYDIQKLNFDDPQNKELLSKIFLAQGLKDGAGIPALVVDDKLIVGDQPIINGFEKSLNDSKGTVGDYIASIKNKDTNKQNQSQKNNSEKNQTNIPILMLLAAAFVDASNPCALAVLILLLATVIGAKGKNHALLSGLMFSLAIFLSYLLMGVGLYKAIGVFGISRYLSLAIGILAILLALANFKDVFWYGKVFIMEIPLSWRPKMQEIIKKATSPWSAFGVGLIVSLFLVPCASGPYVVILGLLAERVDMAKTFSLLLLYNFIFVLPMILITFGMYFFNTRMKKLEDWRKNNLRMMHLIAGVIMMIIGIYLVYLKW